MTRHAEEGSRPLARRRSPKRRPLPLARTRSPKRRPSAQLMRLIRLAVLPRMLDEIQRLLHEAGPSGGEAMTEALYDGLEIAQKIALKWAERRVWREAVRRQCQARHVPKPRKGANRWYRLVMLCFPGRDKRDYSRYAAVLAIAAAHGWSAQRLRRELGDRGGIAGLLRQFGPPVAGRPTQDDLYRAGKKRILARAPLAVIGRPRPDGRRRFVPLLGREQSNGTIAVYRALPNHGKLAKKLVAEFGRTSLNGRGPFASPSAGK